MALKDGLASLEVLSTTVSGTQGSFSIVSGATLVAGAGEITNTELADGAVSGTKIVAQHPIAYTGSPAAGGLMVQTGIASGTGIATAVVVTFGKAYLAAPIVTVTPVGSAAVGFHVVGRAAGSFVFHGAGSEVQYAWIAVGSGR